MPAQTLEQPWKNIVDSAKVPISSTSEGTWLDSLDDGKDLAALSLTACIQASVKMNLTVTKKDKKVSEAN
ncbi:hypothetical protein AMS68_000559 [Peltaster fructicola]|uniref:Uncharacterized protein n=1 Tax=Peltaster fructicola TaxID=286661 RepID=A0A6H0XJZ4_9PEZI|nr:hypothetical protein AMS68_000559 [Peltaster fructicola]